MSALRRPLFVLVLAAVAMLGLAACTNPQQDTTIPWSRPADWEGRIPGMGK